MGLILDSSVAIAAERLGQSAYRMIETAGQGNGGQEIALSAITVLELVHGVMRADTEQRRMNRQRFLDDLLMGLPVHPVTVPIALRAGQIDGLLQAQGNRIALADLLIGTTALELGYAVATHNVRHFGRIPGLIVQAM